MLFKSTAILALGASSVLAKPFGKYRRQETSTAAEATSGASSAAESTAAESVSGSAAQTTATSSVEVSATDASSILSSAASVVSSVSASTGGSSAPAATTTSANGTDTADLAFGCPDGYSLTYVIGTSTYPGVELEQASSVLSNWTGAVPPPIMVVSSEGEGVGATRTWTALNLTVTEELTNQTEEDDGTLEQMWNLTMPLNVSESVVIANATSDLTLYTNSTTNETSVQFFVNFCVNDQPAGLELYAQLVTVYLTGIQQLVSGGGGMGNMTSTGTEAMSSTAAEMTSSAASSASGAADTASSAISGATDTAISGASSVASDGISGASSVIGDATSAVESVVSSLIPTRRA